MRDRKHYFVYILGSLSGTLYIGVTGRVDARILEHKDTLSPVSLPNTMSTACSTGNPTTTYTKLSDGKNNSKVGGGKRKWRSSSPRTRTGWIWLRTLVLRIAMLRLHSAG